MNKKAFIKKAIKSDDDWKWIKKNLKELDYIFQTEEYKKQDGYKHLCLPLLIGKDVLTTEEEDILATAWYLNNQRINKQEEKERIEEFTKEGFKRIENDEKLDGKKIEFITDNSNGFFGGISKYKGKLLWSPVDKALMAMKTRCTRQGYWVTNPNIYVKVLA